MRYPICAWGALTLLSASACGDNLTPPIPVDYDHGAIAADVMAPLGQPYPAATPEQLETFARGREVMERRFSRADGLGPAFNVTFCGACHEKPVPGGGAGEYRNFFIAGLKEENEPFRFLNAVPLLDCGEAEVPPGMRDVNPAPESNTGAFAGVIRQFYYGDEYTSRPDPRLNMEEELKINVIAQRNPIPFFGVGLIAELDESEILKRADPDDEDGDGISGRPNYVQGFVGRFGVKAQTTSIEGFIRGPLFNHLGVTTDPLSEEEKAALPVDSSSGAGNSGAMLWRRGIGHYAQAAAPAGPNCDLDSAPDPEMSRSELFDLVSFSMLLAAPQVEEMTPQRRAGMTAFNTARCDSCHAPRLESFRGPLPVYSDILLHDMGPDLADNLEFADATGSEFRTQPLWGISATGPYLHDGRAHTIDEAIRMHGGEAQGARDAYESFSDQERDDLIEFLLSLGGRSQFTMGLLPPDAPMPGVGEYGGPRRELPPSELSEFEAARLEFDRERGRSEGLGAPRFNGDSCRACHFDPVIGGSGPRGVNVMRHGIVNASGDFVPPSVGTVLHKSTILSDSANLPQPDATTFEHRQTPPLFGLGDLDDLSDDAILANADPLDEDGDGISGKVSVVDGGRIGRFGWKAQVPSLREFVRDAVGTELGMTLPFEEGLTFGKINDNDDVPDPEMLPIEADRLLFFMRELAAPPRGSGANSAEALEGETLFSSVGCAKCHVPSLDGPTGPVPAYTDLLLHEVLPPDSTGIEEASATVLEFRTPPLWGVSHTAPYLHSGAADTLMDAILAHAGEASNVIAAFEALAESEKAALITFLETL
jgi:CxxC motif-containing protein (DUF1111 family)